MQFLFNFHRLGQWQESLHGITDSTVPVVLQCYEEATVYDSNWYKAWHAWAVMNFEACLFYRHRNTEILQQQQPGTNEIVKTGILSPQMISKYAVPALKGFVRSITLSKGNSLQGKLLNINNLPRSKYWAVHHMVLRKTKKTKYEPIKINMVYFDEKTIKFNNLIDCSANSWNFGNLSWFWSVLQSC